MGVRARAVPFSDGMVPAVPMDTRRLSFSNWSMDS